MATIDTKFFGRNQHGGMVVIADRSNHPGNIFWVDSGESKGGDTDGHGHNPGTPFLTIDYAIGQCEASNGDIVYVAPGHAETIVGAGGITMDVAGVSIIGMGTGDMRPTITFTTAAAASVLVSASDCVIANMRFICNITSQVHMIDVAGDDLEIYGCSFKEGSATGLCFISADTADGDSDNLYIHDCDFYAPTAGNYDQAIDLGKDHTGVRINNNDIYGDFDEACVDAPTAGNACANLRIKGNDLSNLLTGQHVIQLSGTAVTGRIVHNLCQTDTQATTIDGSACSCFDNWWCDVDGSNDEEAVPVNSLIAGTIAAGNDAVPAADAADNALVADVVGNKEDAAVEIVGTVKSLMAHLKGVMGQTNVGSAIIISKTITSSDIPDDGGGTPLAVPLTGAASGALLLEEIVFQVDPATGLAGGTTMQVVCDNVNGLTGATVPIWDEATANLGAGTMINNSTADVNQLPIMLETTKKLYINCDDAVGTGAGTVDVVMKFRRITAGASIAAA